MIYKCSFNKPTKVVLYLVYSLRSSTIQKTYKESSNFFGKTRDGR
eukprot:UN08017